MTELHDQAQQALKFAQQSEGKLRETLQLLKQSEERYALAAAGSNDGLWDWDVVRNRVYFSPRWKAMLGLGDDEVGNTLLDWLNRVHPDEVEGLRAALGAHLAGETPHSSTNTGFRQPPARIAGCCAAASPFATRTARPRASPDRRPTSPTVTRRRRVWSTRRGTIR